MDYQEALRDEHIRQELLHGQMPWVYVSSRIKKTIDITDFMPTLRGTKKPKTYSAIKQLAADLKAKKKNKSGPR